MFPLRKKQKITDEDLIEVFKAIEGKWFDVRRLSGTVGSVIPVNDSNPKRSPFGSGYLKRLSRLTGVRWRQKSALGEDGKRLVKVYSEKQRRK